MIKILTFFDERPNVEMEEAYTKYLQQTMKIFEEHKKAGNLIQYKLYTNVLESPGRVTETEWKSMSAWGTFWESKEYQKLYKHMGNYAQSIKNIFLQESMGP